MLPETEQLLATLETIIENLNSGGSGIGSEGDHHEYGNFEEFIAANLRDTRVYVLGNNSLYRLYIIGKCLTGDWLGALTLAVWT